MNNSITTIQPTVETGVEKKKPELTASTPVVESTLEAPAAQEVIRLSEISSTENWLEFVNVVKKEDAFFAAKIENLLFIKSEGKRLTLQAPQNLAFLATQLQDSETKKKFQGYIDSALGGGYTFEVLKSSAMAQGDSAQSLAAKKQIQADDEKLAKWNADPRIQMAKNVFKAEIKLVKPE
jgi:DNA polymerase-3 subunit gamma/tau